ncbi:MAG: ribonuclease H-like domain-containing protein [Gloeomargarita sp. SKYG116]|nr:ribonuclease H-like domain-containing protein [Gloeomargarita sp. SKYG116]MCS7226410.1 ribonuclease H-like domain-containing protein [Gloeomargarita sp. SKYB31]MDW8401259.1 ribonuclease H-like domain-containing protein [Gloeomargarita sp. SKYGB_i_bin116]
MVAEVPAPHRCEQDLSEELLHHYLSQPVVGVDTETMGLIPARDRLCLVQIADAQGQATLVKIQPGQHQAPRLQQLLEAPQVLKIFHYARFDLAALRYHLGIHVAPIFCTKIASKLARTYSPKHGLKDVVQELLGIELDKQMQSSDWGRPEFLSDAQLTYAANDVIYLPKIAELLTAMLQREGRWELAQSCFACVPTFVSLDLLFYQGVFEH